MELRIMTGYLDRDEAKALLEIHALGFDFYLLWLRNRQTAREAFHRHFKVDQK